MSQELIGIITVGVSLGGGMFLAWRELSREITDLRERMSREITDLRERMSREITDLRERMAKLEGLFEGFVGRSQ